MWLVHAAKPRGDDHRAGLPLRLAHSIIASSRYYLGGGATHFVGLANYLQLLADERFWGDLLNTVIIVGCSVALEFFVGLALALALYAATHAVRTDLRC